MALAAPASTTIVPRGSAAKPIHRRREDPRALTGANTVPTGSPIIAGPAFEAHVSTVGMPETAATRAASSFVTMPPVPTLDPEPDTRISPSASITLGTYSTRRDPGWAGGAVYSASTSVSNTNASARTRLATKADSRSLSPKRISLEASESFSLIIGTTPRSSSRSNVRSTLRYWVARIVSSAVIRIWPTRIPNRPNAASYRAINRPCPTAAVACWVATSAGRSSKPNGPKPAAIAPEETSTTRAPISRTCANAAARASSLSGSRCPLGWVRELDPTLTTIVPAAAIMRRTSA